MDFYGRYKNLIRPRSRKKYISFKSKVWDLIVALGGLEFKILIRTDPHLIWQPDRSIDCQSYTQNGTSAAQHKTQGTRQT